MKIFNTQDSSRAGYERIVDEIARSLELLLKLHRKHTGISISLHSHRAKRGSSENSPFCPGGIKN